MSKITVIGGHGKVALILAPLLRQRGDDVRSVVRNPAHIGDVEQTGATAVIADIERLSTPEITELIAGQDAVVWSAGAGGGNPARTYAVDRDAAIRTMDAAQAAGVTRFIMVSYLGAGPGHGVPEADSFFPYAEAKAAADEHLTSSGLDWTILRPGLLTLEEASGSIVLAGREGSAYPTSRANVALAIVAALRDDTTIRRTFEFGDGDTPIAEAFSG